MGVEFYQSDKAKAETYPVESKEGNVAVGMKFEAQQAFAISELEAYEIHISPLFSFDKNKAIFKGILE